MFYINIPHQLPPELSKEARKDVYMTLKAHTVEGLANIKYPYSHHKGAVLALQDAIRTFFDTEYEDYNKYHHQVLRFVACR